jgi:predicted nuclease with TOPRIM domain
MTPDQIITHYDTLVARALKIISKVPYLTFVGEEHYARLEVIGGEATLRWPNAESDYEMLAWTDDRIDAWQDEQARLHEENQRRQSEQAALRKRAADEAHERNLYLALKRKYEPTGS